MFSPEERALLATALSNYLDYLEEELEEEKALPKPNEFELGLLKDEIRATNRLVAHFVNKKK